MATIDNLTLEVNADITKAKKSLDNLATSLTNLKTKMGTVGTAYKNLGKSLSAGTVSTKNINAVLRLSNALSSLNSVKANNIANTATNLRLLFDSIKKVSISNQNAQQLERIARAGDSLSRLNQVRPATIEKTATNLNALQSAMANISIQSVEKIERLATALVRMSFANRMGIGNFGRIVRSANQIQQATPIQSTVTQRGGETANVNLPNTNQVTAWGKAIGSLRSYISQLNPVFGVLKKGLSTISGAFKKAISPITKFLKALARIAFYRMIRSVIKEITQGIKEGIDNLALYSKAIGELDSLKANQVMSGYASYFLYLKNALGTAIMPLLKMLLPLVEAVIQKFVNLLDILAQVGSAFFGMTYTSARLFWVDYADSLDNASRSAGKLHKQLAGFDELNNLTTNSGGGASWFDPTDAFKELEILDKILKFVEKLKEAWRYVKNEVTDLLEPIKKVGDRLKDLWSRVVEKVKPHLDRIGEALKTIWEEGLKPLLEGLIEGFFEGYYGEEFDNLPDLMGFLAEKIADCAEKVADFVKNLDNDKIKEFGEHVGFFAGNLMFLSNPLGWILSMLNPLNSRLNTLGINIGYFLKEYCYPLYIALTLIKTALIALGRVIALVVVINIILLRDAFKQLKEKIDANNDGIIEMTEVINFLLAPLKNWILENVNLAGALLWLDEKIKKVSEKVTKFTEKVQHVIEKIREFFETINVSGKFDGLINGLDKIWQVADKVKKTFEGLVQINLFEWAKRIAEMFGEGKFNSTNSVNIPARANGGFVSRGDLFVANERGAEMVGSVNGNTAVANNQMITEAIAQATYRAMSQALSENGMNITIEGDSDGMFKVLQKKNREYKNMTGRSAFA